jgi:hypothetical protein
MQVNIQQAQQSKPTQYVIRFIAQISWEGQSNGLPPEIYAYVVYEGDDSAVINKIIEDQSGAFIRWQAMAAQKEQGRVIDLNQTPAERMLVPFRWIVSLTSDVHKLGAELSEADEKGVERLSDGTEPLKN